MSNLKTMEVIAKFIGEKTGLKVHIQPGTNPHADPETMQLWLPSDVVDEHIFPAVALAMHEAGHIKFTTFDGSKIVDNPQEFNILNAMEDARINVKIMRMLPNIRSFFNKLYILYAERNKTMPDPGVEINALCNCIMDYEGFYDHKENKQEVWDKECLIHQDYYNGIHGLENGDFLETKACIKSIMQKLGLNPPPPQPEPEGQGEEEHEEDGPETTGGEEGKEKKGDKKKKNSNAPAQAAEKAPVDLGQIEERLRDKKILKIDPNAPPYKPQVVDALAITEATRNRFEEMLKIKEEKMLSTESGVLNTSNLTAFFTEDASELFTETKTLTPKKSKIVIVLDSSGSMIQKLWDDVSRHRAVISASKAIIESIERVNKAEGLCVEWEISGFTGDLIPYTHDNWLTEYRPHGGTDIAFAFKSAQEKLNKELEIQGNKIMIFITDGDVEKGQIDAMREDILRSGSQIKLVIVGVGADPMQDFVTSIIQNRNILAKDDAERVLFDAISICLED